MKKLFLFAATAMLFAACSNEEALAPQTVAETAPGAVGFDVYTAAATRAGDPNGVMTTDKLKTLGAFGVFAYHTDNAPYVSTFTPNFMYNERISWDAGAWTYSPLKYWPNETTQDSQADPNPATAFGLDRVSFFAYAPYVATNESPLTTRDQHAQIMDVDQDGFKFNNPESWYGTETSGILALTSERYSGDPCVEWGYTTDLDNNVDLLWGVAPMGMAYQSVNPNGAGKVDKDFGLPLIDMLKPDKDQKMKFLFQHALSRIGLSVVSAVDQIAAGDDGGIFNNGQTRVLIDEVEIFGDFGKKGVLNLNNTTPNEANWISASIVKSDDSDATGLFKFNGTNGDLAKGLRYEDVDKVTGAADEPSAAAAFAALNTGVLPSETVLLSGGADPSKLATGAALNYAYNKTLYKKSENDYVRATTTATENVAIYTYNESTQNYTQVGAAGASVMDGSEHFYKITLSGEKTVSSGDELATWAGAYFYKEGGTAPNLTYTRMKALATGMPVGKYYSSITKEELSGNPYEGDCYTDLMPRYFMVIPTGDNTPVKVKITYHVVTYDKKLDGYVSDVTNVITKETKLNLKNGKSYNLKLILGLTSVKLDATVADWQVNGSTEVYLPQNNE